MKETELFFPSSHDDGFQIRALLWEPENQTEPRGIVQILHGMAEHIERYRDFAQFLTDNGFITCGQDHIGHGKSVKSSAEWGMIPADGAEIFVENTEKLRLLMQDRFKTVGAADAAEPASPLPYILFGHSMGSFILREYLSQYAEGLSGAIICGTGHPAPMLSSAGRLLAKLLSTFRGNNHLSNLLHNMSVGAYSKQIEGADTPLDWLSTDPDVVEKYIADPGCGFMFSVSGNVALTTLTGSIVKKETIEAVPKELPLLFMAGSDDPVGEKGAAVKKAAGLFKDTGHSNVALTLYEGKRHEVLNEIGKEDVYQDILEWIVAQIEPA